MSFYDPIEINGFKALHDQVIVANMAFDERITHSGIVLLKDDGKLHGIHARWGQVYSVGSEQKEIKVGQWVLIAHGRWTRGLDVKDSNGKVTIRRIDNDDILAISDEKPVDENIGKGL